MNPFKGDYHTDHFLAMHKYIFQDIFDWAGEPRTIAIYKEEGILQGQSVEYSDPGDIMGGKVLGLESERLKAEGQAIGRAEGEAE